MIRAEFHTRGEAFSGFRISGHSGAAPAGSDIVCAAVSSAAYLTANGITEVLSVPADIRLREDGMLSLSLAEADIPGCQPFLRALWIHLEQLSQQYPRQIKLTQTEE